MIHFGKPLKKNTVNSCRPHFTSHAFTVTDLAIHSLFLALLSECICFIKFAMLIFTGEATKFVSNHYSLSVSGGPISTHTTINILSHPQKCVPPNPFKLLESWQRYVLYTTLAT